MSVSKETQEKIKLLFEEQPDVIEKLYECDADAISEVGRLSQKGINPFEIISAYESGNLSDLNNLYQQAKRIVSLQELYKELCFEFYNKPKNASENVEQNHSQRV